MFTREIVTGLLIPFIVRAESRGRIRVHADIERMSLAEADILEYYIKAVPGVKHVKVYDRTCDAVICYNCSRESITEALSLFSFEDEEAASLVPEYTSRASDRDYENRLVNRIMFRYMRMLLLPHPLRVFWCANKTAGYIKEGIKALHANKLNVAVLDATAITVSLVRGDHDTSDMVMFLLSVGDLLEEWAHKKSVEDLAGMMALNAGIAVNTGAAIAREIADITIEAEDLRELLLLRDISEALMKRIDSDYRVIISLNSLLILLGAFGVITPAASSMMHNLSTIGISLYNMTDLIDA